MLIMMLRWIKYHVEALLSESPPPPSSDPEHADEHSRSHTLLQDHSSSPLDQSLLAHEKDIFPRKSAAEEDGHDDPSEAAALAVASLLQLRATGTGTSTRQSDPDQLENNELGPRAGPAGALPQAPAPAPFLSDSPVRSDPSCSLAPRCLRSTWDRLLVLG